MRRDTSAARWGGRLTQALGILVGLVLFTPGSANADQNFNPLPDTGVHTYCFGQTHAPNSLVAERIDWSMGTLEAQTIVDTDFHQGGCTSQTDVRWQQRPIGDGFLGWTNCLNYNQNDRCDQWRGSHRLRPDSRRSGLSSGGGPTHRVP